jgi:hypothetical protein
MASAQPRNERWPLLKKVLSWASTPAAFVLLAWTIQRHGGRAVLEEVIARASTGWPLLLLTYGAGVLVTFTAYRTCLPERGRAVPLHILLLVERSGSALNALLPLGDSSGNLIKVLLLRHWYTSDQIIAAGAWGAIGTGLCNCIAGIGPLAVYALGYLDGPVALLIATASIAASVPAFIILRLLHFGISSRIARLLTFLPGGVVARRKAKILDWAAGLDRNLQAAVGARRSDFRRLVVLRASTHVVRTCEIWLAVTLLGIPAGLIAAVLFHATHRAVTQVFAFIPGRLGILELVSAAVFGAAGLDANTGVEIALLLRFTYFLNLVLSTIALSSARTVARRYPARTAEELLASPTQPQATKV